MDITHNLEIKASAEDIYKAMATQKGITGWWSKRCLVGENEGEKSLLKFDKQGTNVDMGFKTKTLHPNQTVIWECVENANPAWLGTRIVTEIKPLRDHCSVVFSHAGFEDKWKGQEAFEATKGGWEHFTDSLKDYCETGNGHPW
ncbi:MAG: SRPBCC domain-containing protein [Owenweeksia sp.]